MVIRRRGLLSLLLWLALAAGSLAGVAPAAAAPRPTDDPAKGLRYGALHAAGAGSCKGKFEIRAPSRAGGPQRCTHGPDPAPPGIDVRVPRQPAPATAQETTSQAAAEAGTLCTGDGTSGARVQLVYARITGRADRYDAFAASFRTWAARMDAVYSASAAETGGARRVRFVHDAACNPTVLRVTLSTAAEANFDQTVEELWTGGFSRNDRKYLVWTDANVYCGIGEVISDDRAAQSNPNNVYGLFSRVDNGCWGVAGGSVEAHELMHNLGGVQESAPHATPFNHCTDDYDRMCYADGSGYPLTAVCPVAHENVFDCNHDDYFSTAPSAGSYLATHWNTADNVILAGPPGAPTGVSAVAGEGSVVVSWLAPGSDGGSAVTSYVVTPYAGAVPGTPQAVAAPSTTTIVAGLDTTTAYTFRVAATNAVATGAQSPASAAVVPAAGSRFHPLSPSRVLDTRSGNGAPAGKVPSTASIDLQVAGRGGVPASGATAVVLNVTVVEPAAAGYLTVWPSGESRPVASNLNFGPGQTVPNLVVVKLGAAGRVSLYDGGGTAHLVADVAGWYGAGTDDTGSRFSSLSPARILDTRSGNGTPTGKVASSASLDVQVTGRGGVPASGVSAVVLNVTVVDPSGAGYLTAWPTGEGRPVASSLNVAAGQAAANLVVTKVGAGGQVSLYNAAGAAHILADVAGWYGTDGGAAGTGYHAVTPARVLDTRTGNGAVAGKVPTTGAVDLQVAGRGGVPPAGATAVVLNVTAVDPAAAGYLTAWPAGEARPLASNLNFGPGQTVPNLVVVKLGAGGKVAVYNGGGGAHLLADVAGWFGAPG